MKSRCCRKPTRSNSRISVRIPTLRRRLLKVGESPLLEAADPAELAAMTAVANVLLNLNETITK